MKGNYKVRKIQRANKVSNFLMQSHIKLNENFIIIINTKIATIKREVYKISAPKLHKVCVLTRQTYLVPHYIHIK